MSVPETPKRTKSKVASVPTIVPKSPKTFRAMPSHQQISLRAYEMYQSGGCNHGRDQSDWYKAEKEMFAPGKNGSK
jgi:hypothetical protein